MKLADLNTLEETWAARFQARATGGRNALVGFNYQLQACVLAAVRRWLEAPDGPPNTFAETLSDIVEWADTTIVTQVKLREDPASARAAVGDLWLIWQVAAEVIPRTRAALRFKILYRFSGTTGARDVPATWTPPEPYDAEDLSEFRRRLSVEVASDPERELLGLLSNELRAREPRRLVRAWIGRLTAAADEPGGFAQAATDIWSDLTTLRNASAPAPGFHVITEADRPPEQLSLGGFLTGQQPRLRHLVEGYFAPRPTLMQRLSDAFEQWLDSAVDAEEAPMALPVFWIAGPSGSGKSVALLQMLAELHARQSEPVLWLRGGVGALGAAMEWLRGHGTGNGRAVIAVDDPWAPSQGDTSGGWRDALAYIDDLIDRGRRHEVPVLLCCGPTEQSAQMEADLSDSITLCRFDVMAEQAVDLEPLRTWFVERTGRMPPATGDDNVLLVQLFFEWTVGEGIEPFARRFLMRVDAADPSGAVKRALARMLALNRLYVLYPSAAIESALNAEQRELLGRLREDHHIAGDDVAEGGMRLAHPHLANALFNSWFPPADAPVQRLQLLEDALLDVTQHAPSSALRVAPIIALARELERASDTVDPGTAVLLERIYPRHLETLPALPPQDGAADLRAWVLLHTRGAVALDPSPLTVSLEFVADPATPSGPAMYVVTALLVELPRIDPDRAEEVVDGIIRHITVHMRAPWSALHLKLGLESAYADHFQPLAVEWLRGGIRSGHAADLLAALLAGELTDEVIEVVAENLPAVPPTEPWATNAIALLADPRFPREVILDWALRHRMTEPMGLLLASLAREALDPAVAWLWGWAVLHSETARNTTALETLLELVGPEPELVAMCMARLLNDEPRDAFLALALLRHAPQPDIHAAIVEVTKRKVLFDPAWIRVWEKLLPEAPSTELYEAGLAALRQLYPAHNMWSYLYAGLARHEMRDELRTIGIAWLNSRPPGDRTWPYIWELLAAEDPERGHAMGLEWLEHNPIEHPSWGPVWGVMVTTGLSPGMIAIGHALIRDVPRSQHWPRVWSALRPVLSDADALACELGWLVAADVDEGPWSKVITTMVRRPHAVDAAMALLDGADTLTSQHLEIVWALLEAQGAIELSETNRRHLVEVATRTIDVRAVPTPEFGKLWDIAHAGGDGALAARRAMRWLITSSGRHVAWYDVYRRAVARCPSPALDYVVARWLASEPGLANPSYPAVLQLALRDSTREIRTLGMQALERVGHASDMWVPIWSVLWRDRATKSLRALGHAFLAQQPADDHNWVRLWIKLWNAGRDLAVLRALADRWLQECAALRPDQADTVRLLLERRPPLSQAA